MCAVWRDLECLSMHIAPTIVDVAVQTLANQVMQFHQIG